MTVRLNDNIKSVINHRVKARTTATVPAYVDGAIAALADFAVNHCMNNLASTDVDEQTIRTVDAMVASIITLCAAGNKVSAIRLLRVYTGLGLADAKNAVEWLTTDAMIDMG